MCIPSDIKINSAIHDEARQALKARIAALTTPPKRGWHIKRRTPAQVKQYKATRQQLRAVLHAWKPPSRSIFLHQPPMPASATFSSKAERQRCLALRKQERRAFNDAARARLGCKPRPEEVKQLQAASISAESQDSQHKGAEARGTAADRAPACSGRDSVAHRRQTTKKERDAAFMQGLKNQSKRNTAHALFEHDRMIARQEAAKQEAIEAEEHARMLAEMEESKQAALVACRDELRADMKSFIETAPATSAAVTLADFVVAREPSVQPNGRTLAGFLNDNTEYQIIWEGLWWQRTTRKACAVLEFSVTAICMFSLGGASSRCFISPRY